MWLATRQRHSSLRRAEHAGTERIRTRSDPGGNAKLVRGRFIASTAAATARRWRNGTEQKRRTSCSPWTIGNESGRDGPETAAQAAATERRQRTEAIRGAAGWARREPRQRCRRLATTVRAEPGGERFGDHRDGEPQSDSNLLRQNRISRGATGRCTARNECSSRDECWRNAQQAGRATGKRQARRSCEWTALHRIGGGSGFGLPSSVPNLAQHASAMRGHRGQPAGRGDASACAASQAAAQLVSTLVMPLAASRGKPTQGSCS